MSDLVSVYKHCLHHFYIESASKRDRRWITSTSQTIMLQTLTHIHHLENPRIYGVPVIRKGRRWEHFHNRRLLLALIADKIIETIEIGSSRPKSLDFCPVTDGSWLFVVAGRTLSLTRMQYGFYKYRRKYPPQRATVDSQAYLALSFM